MPQKLFYVKIFSQRFTTCNLPSLRSAVVSINTSFESKFCNRQENAMLVGHPIDRHIHMYTVYIGTVVVKRYVV